MTMRLTIWADVPYGPSGEHTQREARRWWAIAVDSLEDGDDYPWTYYYCIPPDDLESDGMKHLWMDDITDAIVGDKRTMRALLEEVDEPNCYLKHCLDWVVVPKPVQHSRKDA